MYLTIMFSLSFLLFIIGVILYLNGNKYETEANRLIIAGLFMLGFSIVVTLIDLLY